MNYKKKSIYCTEKIKTVTTTQTTINIVQNINNNKNTATVISKPNKNTSNVKKQIPLSSYARSKVGSSIANAFDTLDFKIYIDPSVNYSGYYSTKDQSITLRKNDNVLVVFWLGRGFFVNAWQQLRHRSATMDTLVYFVCRSTIGFIG